MKEKAVVAHRTTVGLTTHFVVNKEFLPTNELCYISLHSHIPFIVNIAKEIL